VLVAILNLTKTTKGKQHIDATCVEPVYSSKATLPVHPEILATKLMNHQHLTINITNLWSLVGDKEFKHRCPHDKFD
jgi:hypothetical protein